MCLLHTNKQQQQQQPIKTSKEKLEEEIKKLQFDKRFMVLCIRPLHRLQIVIVCSTL